MRKPKIGDVCHYYYESGLEPHAAIIVRMTEENGYIILKVFDKYHENDDEVFASHFSLTPKSNHWSWPEEEKPKECEHDSYLEYRPNGKDYRYKCMKCNADFNKKTPQSKAEELIDKLWSCIEKRMKMRGYGQQKFWVEVHHLMKEYKGIK